MLNCDNCNETVIPSCPNCSKSIFALTKNGIICQSCGETVHSFRCECGHINTTSSVEDCLSVTLKDEFASSIIQELQTVVPSISLAENEFLAIHNGYLHIMCSDGYKRLLPKDIQTFEDPEGFDVIICNPPYFHQQTQNQNKDLALARHDTYLSLQTLFFKVFQLLKNTGAFYFIHRYDRYDEIVNELQHQHLKIVEKKEIYSKPNKPKVVLFTIKKVV